ncbi:MAG: exodeoxyribonuclease VII small subunit [Gammaproteobacteria bacterium]|nr:exodeoxyribonuclease VII small subunit [Gammaproteobacteria bacterium]MAY03776.1 exodeoxyribonuclease VII small subunit [Gammaproteobacteria bacterium]|tara:strand:- start:8955 stop:9200 length:246 start_codon:yes stop_codon:yes gene_type:complete
MSTKKAKFNFEDAIEQLEELVEALEEGELSLEESLKAFEDGIKLTRECQVALEKAEQRIQLLTKDSDLPEAEAFEPDSDDD